MTNKYLKYLKVSLLCLIAAIVVIVPTATSSAVVDTSAQTCSEKIGRINYRSALLEVYKKSEAKKYKTVHNKWETRISYAGQWVPKDAEKARESLYKYDALHAITVKDINKQIDSYKYLQQAPLDCAKTKPEVLAAKFEEVRGLKNNMVVGGQALIAQDKKNETQYISKDFKKANDSMVKSLHKAKNKHPKPEHSRLDVKPAY